MQGRLWVESEEGAGSTFRFVAWFGTHGGRPATAPWGDQPLRILVAHAHDVTRSAIVELLAPWPGVTTAEAAGGRAAMASLEVAAAGDQPWDVVLVDAGLPALDGFELAERVRATPGLAHHVVILLPTTQLTTGAERAVTMGARYLALPVVWKTLADTLTALLAGPDAPHPAVTGRRVSHRPLRVLVVDDHVVNQAVVSAVLRRWGHAVATALDGREAVDKSAGEPFDLVLMDLQMPEMDGLQATRLIRERELSQSLPRLPIVAMTARAMTADRDQCRAAGMDGFLSKPLDQPELFELLEGVGRRISSAAPGSPAPDPAGRPILPLIADPETQRHVIGLFLDTAPRQLERLQGAVAAGDAAVIAATAHALRGAMSHFAIADVSHLEHLEALGREARLASAPAVLAQVDRDITTLMTALRALQ